MIYPNEFVRCHASGEILMYGDFYYEDDETGRIISAKYYHELKKKDKEDNWDNTAMENYESQKEYQDALREKEQEYYEKNLLKMTVFGKDADNYEKEEM